MAAPEVFVDSSAWLPIALTGRSEGDRARHAQLASLVAALAMEGTRFVTTNLVVAETHQLLLVRDRRETGLTFLRGFGAAGTEVIWSTPELERRAVDDWIVRYQDQDFSLTDAVSFVVMRDRGIRQALALDRHFAAAGFGIVPSRGGGR